MNGVLRPLHPGPITITTGSKNTFAATSHFLAHGENLHGSIRVRLWVGVMDATAMHFRIWVLLMNDTTFLSSVSVASVRGWSTGLTRLVGGVVPRRLLRMCALGTVLVVHASISSVYRCRGTSHGSIVRRPVGLAGLVALLVVACLFFCDNSVAVVEIGDGAKLFGIPVAGLVLALPERRAALARSVVIGWRGAVFLFFLMVTVEEEGKGCSDEEEEASAMY